jgi:hypothetical protein
MVAPGMAETNSLVMASVVLPLVALSANMGAQWMLGQAASPTVPRHLYAT